MKKIIILSVVVLFHTNLTSAQSLKPDTEISAVHNKFKTQASANHKTMFVKNTNNKLDKQQLGTEGDNVEFNPTEKDALLNCFKNVFSADRLKELMPEQSVLVNSYINSKGTILEILFIVNKNTLLRPKEIEELESQIKKNVIYKFRPKVLKDDKFYVVGTNVRFDRVLAIE